MKKIKIYFLIIIILVCYEIVQISNLIAQTKEQTPPDTSKKSGQKIQPKKDRPKLELPDVLIYGTDRSVRLTGDKLNKYHEDVKLVAPIINYQPLSEDLSFENNKDLFRTQRKSTDSKTLLQLDAGRYQQFDVMASRWKEAEKYNYTVQANYGRSNGQYENSQYYQGWIKGQFGIRLSPNLFVSSQGAFQLFDYGLYGSQFEDLQRETSGGKIKVDAQWSIEAEQSTELSIYFQQNNYKDDDAINYRSKLVERNIGLISTYETKYHSTPIFIRALYEYHKLNNPDIDVPNSQKYLQLKSWLTFKVKQYIIIKPGILFENLEVNDSFSEYQFSPDLELIATPVTKIGLLLKASRGYFPLNYCNWWEKNPFVSPPTNFIPMKKEMELKFGIEYHPYSSVSLSGEVIRQNWKNYAYWSHDAQIGLFQLRPLEKVMLTICSFQSKFTLSSKLSFDVGVQFKFDSVKDDSLVKNGNNLPYLERLRFPFNFEYKINETTQALLNFLWVGPRYISLTENEKLSKLTLLSFQVEKQFHKNFSVFIEGNNLLDQKYEFWLNYLGMGLYFEVGLKGNW